MRKLMFTGTLRTRFNKVRRDEKRKTLVKNALVPLFMALSMVNVKETYLCNTFSVTIQMKATERFFPLVLFVMLYKVVLPFVEFVDRIP